MACFAPVSDLLVKVNAAPYVLLLDLWAEVDVASPVVKRLAASSALRISLQKVLSSCPFESVSSTALLTSLPTAHAQAKAEVWPQLEFKGGKNEKRQRREGSMERKSQREAELRAKKQERRYAEEKQTLRAQMAVDDSNRQLLSDLKAEEKQREEVSGFRGGTE